MVYVHINNVNGKMYVGITCQTAKERWRGGKGYKRCPAFYNAIQKYGWDAFEHFIFADGITSDEAYNIEKILIDKLQTQDKDFGYNIVEGGRVHKQTEETRRKISETHMGEKNPMYGRKHTEEEKRHLREISSGKNNPTYGRRHTPEELRKMRESQLGKKLTDEQKAKISQSLKGKTLGKPKRKGCIRKRIPVRCVETGAVYESITEAARQVHDSAGNIRVCLKNPRRTAKSYHWEYA